MAKVKDSFEPHSNQRPKDINYTSTVLRSTNWAIEGTLTKHGVEREDIISRAKSKNLKGFPKFDNSLFSEIGQEVKFPETKKSSKK